MSTFAPSHHSWRTNFATLRGHFQAGGKRVHTRFRRTRLFAALTTLGLVGGIAGLFFINSGGDPFSSLTGVTTNILPSVAWDDAGGQTSGWLPYAGDNGSSVPVVPETNLTVSAGDSHSRPAAPAGH